jgi:Holliday junction resolvase RusA-like endonuclease
MARTIILKGDPKSTQQRHVSRSLSDHVHDDRGQGAQDNYQDEASAPWAGPPFPGDVEVTVCFFFKTKRRCDLDNQNKLILDALTSIAYEDDSQISSLHLSRAYDATNSRMDDLPNSTALNKPQCGANMLETNILELKGAKNGMD